MPTVRRYERQASIDPMRGGMRRAAATALSEGAGVEEARADKFRSVAHTAGIAARIGIETYGAMVEQERDAADQTALLEASNRLAAFKARRLYDPNNGTMAKHGKDALGEPEAVKADFAAVTAEIETGLTTPRQRAAFARLKSQEFQGIDLEVRRHTFQQQQTYRAGELKAHVENAINEGIGAAEDPKLVDVAIQKALGALDANAPSLGVGPEELDAQKRAVTSTVRLGVISQLLAKEKDREAAHYFTAHKDEIAADKYDEIEKALEEGSTRGESQRQADILGATGTLQEQLAKAAKIDDPKVRDAVEDRLRRKDGDRRLAEDQADKAAQLQAYNILDQTPDIDRIPPMMWTRFDGPTRSAMSAYATKKAKGEPVETDLGVYYSLMQQARTSPVGFVGVNLLSYRAKLGEAEFKQLTGLQNAIATADPKAEKEVQEFQTRSDLLDATLTQHGIDPKAKYNTADGKKIAQLRRMLDARVTFLQSGGSRASNADIQAEIDGIMTAEVAVPGRLWGTRTKPILDLTNADIPASEVPEIDAALRRKGRPISDETRLDAYIEAQLRKARQAK